MNTAVLRCPSNCRHDYQDQRYGRGMRVHNLAALNKKEIERYWRCTVCGLPKRSGAK